MTILARRIVRAAQTVATAVVHANPVDWLMAAAVAAAVGLVVAHATGFLATALRFLHLA